MVKKIAVILMFTAALLGNDPAREQKLQQAIHLMESKGDLSLAIPLLEDVARSSDRAVAARGLLYLGQAQAHKSNDAARTTYERIAREFPDQAEVLAEANRRLKNIGPPSTGAISERQLWAGADVDVDASITPDARWMAITDWSSDARGDLAIRDMSTGQNKRLMAKSGSGLDSQGFGVQAILSPDQRQLVYAWYDGATREIQLRVMPNEPGGKPRVVLRNPEFPYFEPAAWSRDGKAILANMWKEDRTAQLAWISAADGSIKVLKSLEWRVPPGSGRPNLSPDGRFIAYSVLVTSDFPDSHIYIIAADGTRETEIVKGPGVNEQPVWTPDGSHILFLSNRSGSFGLWWIGVRDGRAAGIPDLAKPDVGRIQAKGFTRTGSYVYARTRGGEDIFTADLHSVGSGKLRDSAVRVSENFVGSNSLAKWSPDGKLVAFARRRAQRDGLDLVVRNLETGAERTYPGGSTLLAFRPIWSKDGHGLIVQTRDKQLQSSFHRVDLKTGAFTEFLKMEGNMAGLVALSPDEKTLFKTVETREKPPGILAIDVASGQQEQIFTAPEGSVFNSYALSPDGRTFVLKMSAGRGERTEVRLYLLAVDGSNLREIYKVESGPLFGQRDVAWTSDGREVLFIVIPANGERQLMRVPVTGGKAEFTGLSGKGLRHIDLSSDGRHILFGDGERSVSEVWAIDNLSSLLKARR